MRHQQAISSLGPILRFGGALLALISLLGCTTRATLHPVGEKPIRQANSGEVKPASAPKEVSANDTYRPFGEYGRLLARSIWESARTGHIQTKEPPAYAGYAQIQTYASEQAKVATEEFFKGRYNRSRARQPENVERWRSEPDIANPGPDLANFPNSAFTLPQGRAYVEFSPLTYYGSSLAGPAQYNTEFLLRYGATDDIELRLFGNGLSWMGGSSPTWGFSPLAFDTKIQLWTEKQDYFLPAAGFEAYIQTEWLGNTAFNGGTQPSFTFNFDQSLPFDIDLEYNLGVTRFQDSAGKNQWEFNFQWGLQRDLFNKDFAVFIHGFYNAATLPRLPNIRLANITPGKTLTQNAVGAGFVWTVNRRLAIYGQASGGTTKLTPSLISMLGFALSF